ncbi:MAG TPA: phage tail protein [Lactobacillus acetotolerans]|nr:phage tail protein [Lactobacillus acetotolerans]
MDMPTVTAEKMIEDKKFSWVDGVYRGSMPEEIEDNVDETVVLVTEWLNEPTRYANQSFKGWTIGVQVQTFFKLKDQSVSLIDAEIAMARLFKKNGWQIDDSKTNIKDPDTKQWSQSFLFSKNINLKEGI